MLTRAQSLRTIHLCNNPGLSKPMVDWLRQRIRAVEYIEPIHIKPYRKVQDEGDAKIKKGGAMQGAFLKLLGLDKQAAENDT